MKLWSLWILWAVTHRLYISSPYSQKISYTFYLWSFKSRCEAKMHDLVPSVGLFRKEIQLNGSYFCLQEWADSNGRLDKRAKRLVLHGDLNSLPTATPLKSPSPICHWLAHIHNPSNHSCYQIGDKILSLQPAKSSSLCRRDHRPFPCTTSNLIL